MKKKIYNLMYKSNLGFIISVILIRIRHFFTLGYLISDARMIKKQFKACHGYDLDLKDPKTLNEKMNWLKLHDRTPNHIIYADKFAARKIFAERYGEKDLVELPFHTTDWREIKKENMPDYPFIIKPNHGSGWFHIVKDKNIADWNKIRTDCRFWLTQNYYWKQREWQYKSMKPRIIVEKLLICSDGRIPTNFRVHCFHGKVGLIALTIPHGDDPNKYTNLKYDRDWNPIPMDWAPKGTNLTKLRDKVDMPRPKSLDKILYLAEDISKEFKYVRVDFYDVDGKVYHGEITFHDGGGIEIITPFEWDEKFGSMINLN